MKKLLFILSGCFLIIGCDNGKPAKEVPIEPTEKIIKNNKNKDFSIVLDDMQIEESPNFTIYQQKYNVLTVIDDSLHVKKTPWQTVSEDYFKQHENDLGMEIVSKHDNKLTRVAQPVGFGWAVGNEKHGEWEAVQNDSTSTATTTTATNTSNNNNNRRWRMSGSSMFFWYWLGSRRNTYRNDYRGYQSHAGRGAAYYGNNTNSGNHRYGTRSNYQKTTRSSFFTRRSTNQSRWNSFSKRTSRGSSRYSSGSTTRSRSGGTGK